MNRFRLFSAAVAAVLLLVGVWAYYFVVLPYVAEATGFAAKTYCSLRYVSGRTPLSILGAEMDLPQMRFIAVKEEPRYRRINARLSFSGIYGRGDYTDSSFASTAVYRPGLGCTLARGVQPDALSASRSDSPDIRDDMPWQKKVTEMPEEPHAGAIGYVQDEFRREQGTRALLVWHNGTLVAEQYAAGFKNTTPMLGWSMSKSVIHALIGIAVGEEWLSLEENNLRPRWKSDRRSDISLDQLLRMSSGLRFDETYDVGHDAVTMLFDTWAAAEYADNMPLDYAPGTHWQYSSGTTNILSAILGETVRATTRLSPSQFAQQYLFDKLGTESFVIETDAAGQLMGSSFVWATARDWMRFGVMYLYGGEFLGERILPEEWTLHAASFTPGSNGEYGAHFWVNHQDEDSGQRPLPELPADTYYASGFDGQDVVIIPSRDLVVVRLGYTPADADWDINVHLPPLLEVLQDTDEEDMDG